MNRSSASASNYYHIISNIYILYNMASETFNVCLEHRNVKKWIVDVKNAIVDKILEKKISQKNMFDQGFDSNGPGA